MALWIAAYLGGVLTILSPCILPVLPFVFARAEQPFRKTGPPLLLGMAFTFAVIASLAAVGGGWAVRLNEVGRLVAMLLIALFGASLLFPRIADTIARPFVSLGQRLSTSATARAREGKGIGSSLLLGVGTGLLWTPCAGPILGLVLGAAALNGASWQTTGLLLAYALGAATSLSAALLAGGRILEALKRSMGVGIWIRRGLGAAVLVGTAVIALGLDTGLLTQISLPGTTAFEQALLDGFGVAPAATPSGAEVDGDRGLGVAGAGPGKPFTRAALLPVEGTMPDLSGATNWLNSEPLTRESLRGKVVLVDFWTYSCINCLRALPYVRAWAEKYGDNGLVVIGVHAPEFAFERDLDNVRRAVDRLGVEYPVAIDNNYAIWRGFNNRYWPAHYFIDAQGRIRHHHFGEGEYEVSERVIRQLLEEAGYSLEGGGVTGVRATGVSAPPDFSDVRSPETYVGYLRAAGFASGPVYPDIPWVYELPVDPRLNQWGLGGAWRVERERATLVNVPGSIRFRFHARDLHLVMGPGDDGEPVRFRIRIDGKPPGEDHGVDVDARGAGTVNEERLYQLVRQGGPIEDRLFEIEFLDPGVHVYAFTFG